jgi:hypothetical protein
MKESTYDWVKLQKEFDKLYLKGKITLQKFCKDKKIGYKYATKFLRVRNSRKIVEKVNEIKADEHEKIIEEQARKEERRESIGLIQINQILDSSIAKRVNDGERLGLTEALRLKVDIMKEQGTIINPDKKDNSFDIFIQNNIRLKPKTESNESTN